jgi:Sec-independent protein secretion pathway component TatC
MTEFTSGVRLVLGGILGLLIVSSGVTWRLVRKGPAEKYAELAARVKSWWIMVAIFVVAIGVDRRLSIAFFAFISFLALAGIVTPMQLVRFSRWAIIAAFVIGAFITPGPEMSSQFIVASALIALYFLSVGLSFLVAKRRDGPKAAD